MSTTTEAAPPSFAASTESSLPPGYEARRNSGSAAPARARGTRRSIVEREYTLENGGKPWAFLKVNCRPGTATSFPSFIQGEVITGTVELHLDKTEHINSITIEVRGESLSVGQEPVMFLSEETILWSTTMGNPGKPSSGPGSAKLKGDYVWPYSMTIPDKVNVSSSPKGPKSEYSLPPTLSERASPAYLEYKIVVTFRRGKFRVDNVLSTTFAYMPRSRTPAPSVLREFAYSENSSPPGPKGDPEGWEVLGPKSVVGTIFDSRQVEVLCSLALAKPLHYARGTFVPFILTLGCSDAQTLDLCAARGSLAIRLIRALKFGGNATEDIKAGRTDNNRHECVGQGIYWLGGEGSTSSETRSLEGEILVRRNIMPSFIFPRICVNYCVEFSLTVPGFTPLSGSGSATEPTFSHEVVITTEPAPGPAPRSRIPPSQEEWVSEGNYDVSIGILTAANQRFLHHHIHGFG